MTGRGGRGRGGRTTEVGEGSRQRKRSRAHVPPPPPQPSREESDSSSEEVGYDPMAEERPQQPMDIWVNRRILKPWVFDVDYFMRLPIVRSQIDILHAREMTPLLGNLGNIYPRLTREFYKNMKHDVNSPDQVTTVIDGVDLRITARDIAVALGVRYHQERPAFMPAIAQMFQRDMGLAFLPQLPERQYIRRVNLPEELHFIDWVLVNICFVTKTSAVIPIYGVFIRSWSRRNLMFRGLFSQRWFASLKAPQRPDLPYHFLPSLPDLSCRAPRVSIATTASDPTRRSIPLLSSSAKETGQKVSIPWHD